MWWRCYLTVNARDERRWEEKRASLANGGQVRVLHTHQQLKNKTLAMADQIMSVPPGGRPNEHVPDTLVFYLLNRVTQLTLVLQWRSHPHFISCAIEGLFVHAVVDFPSHATELYLDVETWACWSTNGSYGSHAWGIRG